MAKKNRANDHSKYRDWIDPNTVVPYERNAKKHDEKQIKNICTSIRRFGWQQDTVITTDNVLVIGHGRRLAALKLGCEMPYHRIDKAADEVTDEDIRELRIADNQTNAETGFDFELLTEDIADLDFDGFDFDFGQSEQIETTTVEKHELLIDKFIVPPFSVLDTKQGYWQERKAAWREKIGDFGQARGDAQLFSDSLRNEDKYKGKSNFSDVSILDPVLSEAVCKWFAPGERCNVFDCFAGDTVFGYVSSYLGHKFTGIELRQEQADFNNNAVKGFEAHYICDDGRNVQNHIGLGTQDMFFSCPPYFDLEVYSDDPNDASNQPTYNEFYNIIDNAFTAAVGCLKENRFAVVVCGDVRDKKSGAYYDFPGDIKATFKRNGCLLYNELILVDSIGTAAIRAQKYMKSRKCAKVHQNVLVFYKGDTKQITKEFPELEVQYESTDME